MSANWVGPRRVVQVLSNFILRVEHLLTKEAEDTHVSRIKPYTDGSIESPVALKEIADFSDRIWYSVDKIKDIRETNGVFEVLVSWKDLTTAGDSWEPLTTIFEDVPTKVRTYFKRSRLTSVAKKAKTFLEV